MDVTLEPGEGHDFHRHPGQEEMIIVKQGAMTQYIERESTTLGAGDSVYLDAGVVHASFNDGDETAHLQVVIGPSLGDERLRPRGRLGRGALGVAALTAAPSATEQLVGGQPADRRVDELDRVERGQRPAGAAKRGRHLDEAAGVAARVGVGLGREHVRGLAVAELRRGVRAGRCCRSRRCRSRAPARAGSSALEARNRVEHRAAAPRRSAARA